MVIRIEVFENFYKVIQQPPGDINVIHYRDIIRICGEIVNNPKEPNTNLIDSTNNRNLILKVYTSLDNLLFISFPNTEIQYVCGTAFCSLINILPIQTREMKLDNLYDRFYAYLQNKEEHLYSVQINPNCFTMMALINGLYTSNAIFSNSTLREISEKLLRVTLELTLTTCMSYNVLTSLAFRNLNTILGKVIEWKVEDRITSDLFYSMLVMLYNNWENPLCSIRDLICKILNNCFHMLHDVLDHFLEHTLLFPWNRGKYYTLCEIIPHMNFKEINFLFFNTCCLGGLKISLKNQGLVTAGTSLYRTLLNKYYSFDEWYVVFYKTILESLMGKERDVKRNMLTYWMPFTIKQHPQIVFMLMNSFYENCSDDEVLYSFLFILKLARKNGITLKVWKDLASNAPEGEMIRRGLKHRNEDIRIQAIQVISNYPSYTILPTVDEMEIMKDFLRNNVNYDSPSFRQNTIKCFSSFIIILRDSFLSAYINKRKNDPEYKDQFDNFFSWIYDFIIENLISAGNYQRKITALQLYETVLKYTYGGYEEEDTPSSNNAPAVQAWKVVDYLRDRQKWHFNNDTCVVALIKCVKHTARDIKELAVHILSMYFLRSEYLVKLKADLFINGIVMCNSRMFYEVDSGIAMFKIIARLNVAENCDTTPGDFISSGTMTMITFFHKKIEEQYAFYKEDILYSIYNNQPLFGIIAAMNGYMKCQGVVIARDDLKKIINLIKEIMEYVLNSLAIKSENPDEHFPPSFAEIDKSIKHIIKESDHTILNTPDNNTQLSNSFQLVMNNLWLTLKVCCEVSCTILTNFQSVLELEEDVESCLNISIIVLKRCRLKGAIEFAGTSLGTLVKFISALPEDKYDHLLGYILEKVLLEITNNNRVTSVTRRSAGLSILVHKLVTCDSRAGKPLYYKTMSILMNYLKLEERRQVNESPNTSAVSEDNSNSKDIPRAIILHILCRIIKESSLHSLNLKFISQLTIYCFKHIVSEQWQIRNAALQLHGALVPRLIGQQQSQGTTGIGESPTSADELFSHFPKLWTYVADCIKNASHAEEHNVLKVHSNLIPILSLLSHMGRRNFYHLFKLALYVKYERPLNEKILNMPDIDSIYQNLNKMLGSPIFAVRNLCAKIIESFYSAEAYYKYWIVAKSTTNQENELHGNLLVLRNYIKFHFKIKNYLPNHYTFNKTSELERMLYDMGVTISRKKTSYTLKALYVETLFELKSLNIIDHEKCLTTALKSINSHKRDLNLYSGLHNWINVSVYNTILDCNEDDLMKLTKIAMNEQALTLDSILLALKSRLESIAQIQTVELLIILLYNNMITRNDFKTELVEIIYLLSKKPSIKILNIYTEEMTGQCYALFEKDQEFIYDHGHLLPLIAMMVTPQFLKRPSLNMIKLVNNVTSLAKNLSNIDKYMANIRIQSARSLKYLIKLATDKQLNDHGSQEEVYKIKYNIITTLVLLLQDEDVNVRNECTKLKIFEEKYPTHPTRQLRLILVESFLQKYFSRCNANISKFLSEFLDEIIKYETKIIPEVEIINPFENETQNIYWELELIKEKLAYLLMRLKSQDAVPPKNPHLL